MKKLNVAIIGQGRSGKGIHGVYFTSKSNVYYTVKYVVDEDEYRRNYALGLYPDCKVFSDYRELYNCRDIDVVINASYSNFHFEITKDLLEHGYNVMVEKPFARNQFECQTLINTAKKNSVVLAVFQQTFYSPIYFKTKEIIDSGVLGKVEQISIRYNGFSRRWDWQTLQKRLGGGLYNNGPHPIGLGLGFIGFDKETKLIYSKCACTDLTSGDGDDYAKLLFTAPGKALVDIEVASNDAYSDYAIKVKGAKGTYVCTQSEYKYTYIVEGENVVRAACEDTLRKENGDPCWCGETLIKHEEKGVFDGSPFDVGTSNIYEDLYYAILEGRRMMIYPEIAMQIIGMIEAVHAENPLPLKY